MHPSVHVLALGWLTVHKRIKNVNNHESLYFLDQNLILWVRKPVSPKSEQSQGRNLPRLLLALSESKSPWIFLILLFADFWLADRLSSGLWLVDVWQLRFISSYQNFRLGDFISPPICWRTLQSANERALLFWDYISEESNKRILKSSWICRNHSRSLWQDKTSLVMDGINVAKVSLMQNARLSTNN